MLENTFIHAPGVGETTEARLWAAGVRTWSDFLSCTESPPVRLRHRDDVRRAIEESVRFLERSEYRFFAQSLPPAEHWRAYPDFRRRAGFLDIETTGMGAYAHVTVIGISDGTRVRHFIRGENMDEFPEELARYSLLVTFNGATFDLPFLRRAFRRLEMDQIHVDLRYALARLGHTGGLKRIEHELGIRRSPETEGLDGFDAVRLWYEHQRGSDEALQLLLEYNREDVANMVGLMERAYAGLRDRRLGPPPR